MNLGSSIVNMQLSHLFDRVSTQCLQPPCTAQLFSLWRCFFKISNSSLLGDAIRGLSAHISFQLPACKTSQTKGCKKFTHFQSADRLCKFSHKNPRFLPPGFVPISELILGRDGGGVPARGYSCLVHKHLINEPPEYIMNNGECETLKRGCGWNTNGPICRWSWISWWRED